MGNLLKRNEDGSISRICHHNREMNADLGCAGCEHRTKCNAAIFERLMQFEEIGLEPRVLNYYANNFDYVVTEMCPHCESENTFVWDVSKNGYKVHCPSCGKTMMLCDECTHAEDGLNKNSNHCDWKENEDGTSQCFRCEENTKIKDGCKGEKKLCPFKKTVKAKFGSQPYRKSYMEYFVKCDKNKCMAFKDGKCLRLEGETK